MGNTRHVHYLGYKVLLNEMNELNVADFGEVEIEVIKYFQKEK